MHYLITILNPIFYMFNINEYVQIKVTKITYLLATLFIYILKFLLMNAIESTGEFLNKKHT